MLAAQLCSAGTDTASHQLDARAASSFSWTTDDRHAVAAVPICSPGVPLPRSYAESGCPYLEFTGSRVASTMYRATLASTRCGQGHT